MVRSEPFDARVVGSRLLTPFVRELVLERADGQEFRFDPGQWVNLVLPLPEGELKRAYSIASAPQGSPRFEVAVTRVAEGPGSGYLHGLPEGAILRAIGPQGLFTRSGPELAAPSLFVATGTGVTPLRSMMLAARKSASTGPLWLLFGARHEADILYREELEAWAREDPRFRYEVTLSQPHEGWNGRQGYVQSHVPDLFRELAAAGGPAGAPHVYVCGLERMVKAVRDLLRGELGVERKHVHTERYD